MKILKFAEFVNESSLNEIGNSSDYAELTWGNYEDSYDWARFQGNAGKFMVTFDINNSTLGIDFDRDDNQSYNGTSSDVLFVMKNVVNAAGQYFLKNRSKISMLRFSASPDPEPEKADKRIEIYKNYFVTWSSKNDIKIKLLSQTGQETDEDDDTELASCVYSIS